MDKAELKKLLTAMQKSLGKIEHMHREIVEAYEDEWCDLQRELNKLRDAAS